MELSDFRKLLLEELQRKVFQKIIRRIVMIDKKMKLRIIIMRKGISVNIGNSLHIELVNFVKFILNLI